MADEKKSNGHVPDGVFPFQMPPGLKVKEGKARKLSAKEWSLLEGIMLQRRQPDGQSQEDMTRAWFDEHAYRCLVELDGVAVDRDSVMNVINDWDAPTHRAFEFFFRKLDGPTGDELEAFDFFGGAGMGETSLLSPSE